MTSMIATPVTMIVSLFQLPAAYSAVSGCGYASVGDIMERDFENNRVGDTLV